MGQIEKIGSYEFLSEPFHCDFSGNLSLGHLGNHLLNAADFHSADRGFGMRSLLASGRAWVLSRLVMEMASMPAMYSRFRVDTWVESALRHFTHRCFHVVGADGTTYGYGRSVWAMIDTATRHPVDLLADGELMRWVEADKPCPIAREGRVKLSAAAAEAGCVKARYSDVDINGHVNSIKYIEHVLDLWPIGWHRAHRLRRFEVAYVAEAHEGDLLSLVHEQVAAPSDEGEEHLVSIVRRGEADPQPVEVCRCRLLFC